MKAYLIDPVNKSVTQVEVEPGIKAIYAAIKADRFDCVVLNEYVDTVYVSDEGLIDGTIDKYGMFTVKGRLRTLPLAGYGLVLGTTAGGASTDPAASLASIRAMIAFPSMAEIRQRAAQGEFD